MNYPNCLYQLNRAKQDDSEIKNNHYLYMRNKPGHSWNIKDAIPDFTKIAMDQSLNWCKYSIPEWIRFNDRKEYLQDYAVVGVTAEVIRYTNRFNSDTKNFTWTVEHKPFLVNYSHCELVQIIQNLNKTQRRALRMTLKHKSKIYLRPNQKSNMLSNLFYRIKMKFY